jgi:hypothetical protein
MGLVSTVEVIVSQTPSCNEVRREGIVGVCYYENASEDRRYSECCSEKKCA